MKKIKKSDLKICPQCKKKTLIVSVFGTTCLDGNCSYENNPMPKENKEESNKCCSKCLGNIGFSCEDLTCPCHSPQEEVKGIKEMSCQYCTGCVWNFCDCECHELIADTNKKSSTPPIASEVKEGCCEKCDNPSLSYKIICADCPCHKEVSKEWKGGGADEIKDRLAELPHPENWRTEFVYNFPHTTWNKRILDFISKVRQEAITTERSRIVAMIDEIDTTKFLTMEFTGGYRTALSDIKDLLTQLKK